MKGILLWYQSCAKVSGLRFSGSRQPTYRIGSDFMYQIACCDRPRIVSHMNCRKVRMFQKGVVRPVFIKRSRGLLKRVSANFSAAPRATKRASSQKDTIPKRQRQSNSSPGLKNSFSG